MPPNPFKRRANPDAARRIRDWTRARFTLPADETVMVAELACSLPGCPPLETVIAFWTAPDRRHSFKVFKSLDEVREDDLPPFWMKDALLSDGAVECC